MRERIPRNSGPASRPWISDTTSADRTYRSPQGSPTTGEQAGIGTFRLARGAGDRMRFIGATAERSATGSVPRLEDAGLIAGWFTIQSITMKARKNHPSDDELFASIADYLEKNAVGVAASRSSRWRTAAQLAAVLPATESRIEGLLRERHRHELQAIRSGAKPSARVRRAFRPDLETACNLWGATCHRGWLWPGFPDDGRTDGPGFRDDATIHGTRLLFISHAHRDEPLAREVKSLLEPFGVSSWLAEEQIHKSGIIADEVHKALGEADGLVFLLTRHSAVSLWCRTEFATLLQKDGPVLVVIDGSDAPLMRLLEGLKVAEDRCVATAGAIDGFVEQVCGSTQYPSPAAYKRHFGDLLVWLHKLMTRSPPVLLPESDVSSIGPFFVPKRDQRLNAFLASLGSSNR